jgi:YHS domain-containing protein
MIHALTSVFRRFGVAACFAAGAAFALPVLADEITTYVSDGAAIGGTDPVSYHLGGEPLPGSDEFTTTWDGVTWKFSSAANRDAFAANPEKYAPAYGGFCATGASFGKKVPIDPVYWKIVDGTLYLNNSSAAQDHFLGDETGTISRANKQWEQIQAVPAGQL